MMGYYHQTENRVVHGMSTELHYSQNDWFERDLLSGETSNIAARASDGYCIEEMGTSESSCSYMGSHGASDSGAWYPIIRYEPAYCLEQPQIADQSPGPFQGDAQLLVERHSLSTSVDHPVTEPVLHTSAFDLTRQEASSKTRPTTPSRNSSGNNSTDEFIHEKEKHRKGKKSKSKSKRNLRPKPEQTDQFADGENCGGDEVPPTLKYTCPEEERFVLECEWRHRHKRDQDRWDCIQDDFFKKFNHNVSKAVLRMKFSRAKAKYIQWLSEDEDTLRKAWEKVELDRYQTIFETFRQLGGSSNMRLNASDIEVKLAKDATFDKQIYLGRSRKSVLSSLPAKNSSQ